MFVIVAYNKLSYLDNYLFLRLFSKQYETIKMNQADLRAEEHEREVAKVQTDKKPYDTNQLNPTTEREIKNAPEEP